MNKQKINRLASFAIIAFAVAGVLLAGCKDIVRSSGVDVSTVKMGKVSQELLLDGIPLTLYRVTADELFVKITKESSDNDAVPFTATVKQTAKDAAKVVFDLSAGTNTATFSGKKWGVEVCKKDESKNYKCTTNVTAAQITPDVKIDDNVQGSTILQTGIPVSFKNIADTSNITFKAEGDAADKLTLKLNSDGDKILVIPQPSKTCNNDSIIVKAMSGNTELKKQGFTGITVTGADAYRHFTDKDGKDYVFGLVSQEHFLGTSAPSGFSQGSGGANATVNFGTAHVTVFAITQTSKGQNGNSLHITGAPSSYDYMEFKFKDLGDAGITIRIAGKEWVYRDGKFKFFATAGSNFNATQIIGEDKVIKTTYNKNNSDDVVFGIWNGTTGSDANTSLFMECASNFSKDNAECHFVYDNAGTENIGGSTTIDFIVEPSGNTSNTSSNQVELDYIAFYKKQ